MEPGQADRAADRGSDGCPIRLRGQDSWRLHFPVPGRGDNAACVCIAASASGSQANHPALLLRPESSVCYIPARPEPPPEWDARHQTPFCHSLCPRVRRNVPATDWRAESAAVRSIRIPREYRVLRTWHSIGAVTNE